MFNLATDYYEDNNTTDAEKYYFMTLDNWDNNLLNSADQIVKKIISFHTEYDSQSILALYLKYHNILNRNDVLTAISNAWNNLNDANIQFFVKQIQNFKFEPNDNIPATLKLFINTLNDKISLLDLHFKYAITGEGYNQAKFDFIDRVSIV